MRKFFSLLTAILFAGSMMAAEVTVSKTVKDLATANSWTNATVVTPFALDEVITVGAEATDVNTGKYYTSGQQIRLYQSGKAKLIISAAEGYTISSITLTYDSQNTGIFNEAESGVAVDFSNVQSATFTVGNSGTATNGQARITAFSVTYESEGGSTPPVEMTDAEKLEAYIALLGDVKTYVSQFAGLGVGAEDFANQVDQLIAYGNMALSSGDATTISAVVAQAEGQISSKINDLLTTGKDGLEKQLDNLLADAQGCEACVNIVNSLKQTVEGIAWDSNKSNEENLANLANQTEQILKDAQEGIEKALNPASDPTNCAEAAAAALSVSANNEEYNGGKSYTIQGYVTEIAYAYSASSGNMSFWMADTKDGGKVLEAYKCTITSAENAPAVGDKVAVTGKLTKYGTTPEFAAGCTVAIIEKAGGDTPGGGDTPAVTDPTNCAEARTAALSVSANNEEYNGGKSYTIQGYVTEIAFAYDATKGNMSFWMADTKDGGKVLEAYKCTITSAENAPAVGDKVAVTGKLTKYGTTPEFAAGCTVAIIEKAGGDTPGGGDTPAVTDPTNCAEARTAALSVSGDNVPYNDSTIYTIKGYVTSIQTAYSPSFGNISFWMADTKDGGNVIEPYRCVPESAEEIPAVGDYVEVKGALSKYKSNPQFMAGCTCRILEKDIPAANLGEKTIAEFLALKNMKDTCILTGVVANIVMDKQDETQYNKYGNFDLVELGNDEVSVYIYGLLTADGQAQKFAEMGVDENDTLVIKAIYSEYNGTPQVANAIFVEVRKAAAAEWEPWDFVKTQYIAYEGDGYVDINLFTNDSYYIEINEEGGQDLYGEGDCTILTLDLAYTDLNDLTGSYSSDKQTLDLEYTFAVTFVGDETEGTQLGFTSGSVSIAWNSDKSGYVLVYNLTDTYGRFCSDTLDIPLYGDAPSGDNVQIYVNDATWDADEEGYWLIYGQTDSYMVGLSNSTVVEGVDGTYTVADLDPEYSYIVDADNNQITLVSGSIEVYTEDGSVYVEGTVVGSDGVTYELYLAYENVQPTGEEVTIKASGENVVYADNVASQGWWIIQGRNADYTVQLSNYYSIEQAAGTYDNADLDPDYSWVAYNNDTIAFASGSITLAEDRGAIILTGDLLGKDGTLYHLDFMYGEPVDPSGEEVTIKAEGNNVAYRDAVASSGWWILSGHNDTYSVQLSNLSTDIEQAAGTYTAAELDPDYSWVAYNQDTLGFVSGAITLKEYPRGVMVTGSLLAKDGVTYNLELIYGDTTAVDPSLGERINVTMTSGLQWQDNTAVAGERWWYLTGQNEAYYISLSNLDSAYTAAGAYTWEQMDKTYSYIVDMSDTTQIAFYSGTIEVAVDEFGKVTVTGELVAVDNNTYVLNLQYVDPKPETTVEILDQDAAFTDYTGSMFGLFNVSGCTADSTVGVQLTIDAQTVAGTYTEQDFDSQWAEYFGYSCILLKNAAGEWEPVNIYTATITIVDGGNGAYTLTADLLCYNNTLYKVTLSVPAVPTGIEETVAAGKAAKILRNGQIYILKGDKIFNIMGAAIR